MRGTWQTTGSSGAIAGAGIVVAAAAAGAWAAARIWWIIGTVAVSGVLAVAAVVWLTRRNHRHAAEAGAELAARRAALAAARPARQVPQAQQLPAIEQHVHYHWHAAPDQPAPAIGQVRPEQM